MHLYILYGSGLGFNVIYIVEFSLITGINAINTSLVSSLIGTIVYIILNCKYFTKRASLLTKI